MGAHPEPTTFLIEGKGNPKNLAYCMLIHYGFSSSLFWGARWKKNFSSAFFCEVQSKQIVELPEILVKKLS